MEYNDSQKQAIFHKDGAMMVLAGPGSGKTLVITRRTRNLIEEYGINPSSILVITFTKAAAAEMKERFLKLMGAVNAPVNFGTFHAVFFNILKYAYNYSAKNIVREDQKIKYFREIVEELEIEVEDEKEFIASIESEVSYVKGERMDINHYYSMNCAENVFRDIYEKYEAKMRNANLIDFDDMLLLCYELLIKRPDILKLWQDKYQYILIDEFQDINQVQYDIIKLLAKPQDNLFIVGDDDQSIYHFRGAKPEIMLNFGNDYKNAKTVLLGINYRSTKNIVNSAGKIIKNNKKRYEKEIKSLNEVGTPVSTISFKNLLEENQFVIERIRSAHEKGIAFSEMAVLFRTNTQPRALIGKMMEYNIPFKIKDVVPNIFDHWIARDIKSYIELANGNRERAVFLKIMNRPNRYISRNSVNDTVFSINGLREYYSDKDWMIERINKFEYDINMLKDMSPYAAIAYLQNAIGYADYLKEYADYRKISLEELNEVLEELKESAREYKKCEEWFEFQENYAKELKERLSKKNREKDNADSVCMMTMHSSKGLEYETVFIIDANEGITPHHKALLPEDLEEERRMFYVAVTRAKKNLNIYSVKERYGKEMEISRFIGELLLDISKLIKGTIIEHSSYGQGTIISNENGKLKVKFDRIDKIRILDIEFCMRNALIRIVEREL